MRLALVPNRDSCGHRLGAMHMSDYRMYCLDGAGHIGSGEWFQANNDDDALAFVRGKKLSIQCEVWSGSRLVGIVAAHSVNECEAEVPTSTSAPRQR